MRIGFGIVAWLLVASGFLRGQQAPSRAPDEIFFNGKIITVDSAFSIRQAFAVKGDRLGAVAGNKEVLALAGPGTRRVNLRGHAVIPGLMDNHDHQYRAANTLLRGVDMGGVRSVAEMLNRIRQAAAKAKPGEAVFTTGGWRPEEFPEKRPPTRQELDQVSAGHPVLAFESRLQAFANTVALRALGINRETKSFAKNPVPKDASGEPTGSLSVLGNVLLEATSSLIPPPTDEERKKIILKMQARQNALGLTSIRELQVPPEIMRSYWGLWREGKLTLRVSMGLEEESSANAEELEGKLKPWGVGPGFGDHWLRLDCVAELLVDGLVEQAFLREPFVDPPGNYYGDLLTTPEKLQQVIAVIARYGWRPSVHIIGDKALDVVLDAYEAADRVSSVSQKRWVVEHIVLVHPDQMERLARLGVMVSAQPFPSVQGARMLRAWGEKRANEAVPMRTLLDHHLVVSGGSDFPALTSNPFANMYFYVTRKTMGGKVMGGPEKISREEALRVSTINNAYLTYEEKVKGSIEAGRLADFLILSDDILTVPEEQIRAIHPLATYVGGRKVFATEDGDF